MEQRYGDMTRQELLREVADLNERAQKAEQKGMVSEFAVHARKKLIAQSYLLDKKQYVPGQRYRIEGEEESRLLISYLKGVFAWGYRDGETEMTAIPISLLIRNET
ncbi:transcription regulator [Geomicrobium sp. JCM 19037]|uniref:YfhH family protein n=1 Tax=unclassified Geomicrobium TaxID=2628951 RepID=UPI00045F3F37|nr:MULTISPECIES: YfhH family protein [unclassified Geomicrobium]GAK06005.1 transcription regulator [Geomicrobium sp. JCM 19037]GAK13464.1 transcription regulator [Geomicrobium sp. JCM 19039]